MLLCILYKIFMHQVKSYIINPLSARRLETINQQNGALNHNDDTTAKGHMWVELRSPSVSLFAQTKTGNSETP